MAREPTDANDPKGLVREAYRIDGITYEECRSIFLDWALSLGAEPSPQEAIAVLLERHGSGTQDHPMTAVLTEGLAAAERPRRRGGWRSAPARAFRGLDRLGPRGPVCFRLRDSPAVFPALSPRNGPENTPGSREFVSIASHFEVRLPARFQGHARFLR